MLSSFTHTEVYGASYQVHGMGGRGKGGDIACNNSLINISSHVDNKQENAE